MFIKIFTLEFSVTEGRFNDAEVADFIKDKRLISIKDYMVEKNGRTFLTVVVTYSSPEKNSAEAGRPSMVVSKSDDWKELINKDNEVIFNDLKSWRLEESRKQSLPPFILFTNKQLAEIVSLKPQTLNHLSQIDGIGPMKIQKYGDKILGLITQALAKKKEETN